MVPASIRKWADTHANLPTGQGGFAKADVAPAREQPSGIPVGPPPEGFVVFGQISEFGLAAALAEALSGSRPNYSLLTRFLSEIQLQEPVPPSGSPVVAYLAIGFLGPVRLPSRKIDKGNLNPACRPDASSNTAKRRKP